MTNGTRVKVSMETQSYKIVSTRAHEASGRKIIYRLLHSRVPNIEGTNSDVQSNLVTLEFNNR